MIKDYIKYNDKEYQISTIMLVNYDMLETMVFPINNGIISGNEVYCFRTFSSSESQKKHADILYHPEKYLTEDVIKEYKKSKYYDDIWIPLYEQVPPINKEVELKVVVNGKEERIYVNRLIPLMNGKYVWSYCDYDYDETKEICEVVGWRLLKDNYED